MYIVVEPYCLKKLIFYSGFDMGELLNSILGFVDYQSLLTLVAFYLVALWLMFCFWVVVDARKRYHNVLVAVMMGLLVFVFSFPALIFYLIIRPEEETQDVVYSGAAMVAGANVPMVNFVGPDGEVQMSLNLHIHRQLDTAADMDIHVDLQGQQQVGRPSGLRRAQVAAEVKESQGGVSFVSRLREKAKSSMDKVIEGSRKQFSEDELDAQPTFAQADKSSVTPGKDKRTQVKAEKRGAQKGR